MFSMKSSASFLRSLTVIVSLAAPALTESFHKTSDTVGYKCIFNRELLIVCHNKTNSAQTIRVLPKTIVSTERARCS